MILYVQSVCNALQAPYSEFHALDSEIYNNAAE